MEISRRTILRAVMTVIIVAVVAPFVVFSVPQVVGAEHSYVVLSGSMTPAIGVDDAVIVDGVAPESVETGDVIAFRTPESTDGTDVTTHRVVDIDHHDGRVEFTTKGDANGQPDPSTVSSSALIGRVAFTIPWIGHVVEFTSTRLGLLTLVALPLALLVLGEVYDLVGIARTGRDETDEGPPDS